MPFGIKSAPEEFQRRLDECLEGLENISVNHDDIVIFGSSETREEATASHDVAFKVLLERCREWSLKLNKKKLCFKLSKVAYVGHILGSESLQADPENIQAIQNMPCPTAVHGVQPLIGVDTYLSKFLAWLSTVCEPLCRLTDSNSVFDWLPQHEDAFVSIKELITQAPVLRYFWCQQRSHHQVRQLLRQPWRCPHPGWTTRCLCFSCTNLDRKKLFEIEKECLAIVFAAEPFEHYILGKDTVQVLSDHKPLFKTNPHKPQMPWKDETLTIEVPSKGIVQAWPSNVHRWHSVPSCSSLALCQTRLTWFFKSAKKRVFAKKLKRLIWKK